MSTPEEVNEIVERVAANKAAWARLPLQEKLTYLLEMQQKLDTLVEKWAVESARVRKVNKHPHLRGFSYLTGVGATGLTLSAVIDTYVELIASGKAPQPVSVRKQGEQNIVTVYPHKFFDKVLAGGSQGELYLEPGKPVEQAKEFFEAMESPGKLYAILCAGNFESPNDILTKMFFEHAVVVCKANPQNASAAIPFYKELFSQLIKDGFVEILSSASVEVGQALINRSEVDEVLMTGGMATYDRIVWGRPEEQQQNKSQGKKLFTKPFKAELGAASPFIIVPGNWTQPELLHNAEFLASLKLTNTGNICASPQIVILDRDWPQKQQFLNAVKDFLQRALPQPICYPGAKERIDSFIQYYKELGVKVDVVANSSAQEGDAHWAIFYNIPADSRAVTEEFFGHALATLELETNNDPVNFMQAATQFCNTKPFGSLSCSILIDPQTEKHCSAAFEEMLSKLEWGTIAVNEFGGIGYAIQALTWGAFPNKHSPESIGSGCGKVNNSHLYSHVQKSVIRGKWMSAMHQKIPDANLEKVMSRIAYFMVYPSWWRLFRVISGAVFGI